MQMEGNYSKEDVLQEMMKIGYLPTESVTIAVSEYLSGRALNLYGEFGGGKSVFWKVMSMVKVRHFASGSIVRPFCFAVIPMARVASFSLAEIRRWVYMYENWELVVDDIGSEPKMVDYGKRSEAIDLILSMRESSPMRTHITTNVDGSHIMERYGERISDRISYAKRIKFEGKSMRGVDRFRVAMNEDENYKILQTSDCDTVVKAGLPKSVNPRFNWNGEDYD